MKDKCFIYYGNPCVICLADPAVQSFEDAEKRGGGPCEFYPDRRECSPPSFGCVPWPAPLWRATSFSSTVRPRKTRWPWSATSSAAGRPFRRNRCEAYIDTSEQGTSGSPTRSWWCSGCGSTPARCWTCKPGERVFRSAEETWTPPLSAQSRR